MRSFLLRAGGVASFSCVALLACRGDVNGQHGAPSTSVAPVLVDVPATPRGGQLLREAHERFHLAASKKHRRAPILTPSAVDGFRRVGESFVGVAQAPRRMAPSSEVSLPAFADGEATITSGGMSVAIRPRVGHSAIEWAQRIAIHASVEPGVTLFRRIDGDGLDDLYEVESARDTLRFSYDLTLRGVAGLRLVEGNLELLDASGAPRLRAPAPIVFAADGARRVGTLEVHGCAVDRDPRGPWGRAVVAPGAAGCEVVATIDARGLSFPVLVDPAWVATGNMKATHAFHKLVSVAGGTDSGKILALGGTGGAPISTELYDPTTGTWAVSSTLPDMLGKGVSAVALSDGKVVIAGGFPGTPGAPAKNSVFVRGTTGTWTAGALMSSGRAWFALAKMTIDGKESVFAAGGMEAAALKTKPLKTSEIYDPATDTWIAGPAMVTERSHFGSAVLSDGRLMVAGGHGLSGTFLTQLTSTEIFNPTTKTWTTAASMYDDRSDGELVPLASGTAVITGGWNDYEYGALRTIEYFNGTTWSTIAGKGMTEPRMYHVAAKLSDTRILLAAGNNELDDPEKSMTATSSADLLDLGSDPKTTAKIVATAAMTTARIAPAWIALGSKVLVTGGMTTDVDGSETISSEIYDVTVGAACTSTSACPSGLTCTEGVCCKSSSCPEGQTCAAPGFEGTCTKPKGAACTTNSECGTGFCVAGVCCVSACASGCETCNEPGKLGDCVMAKAGTDPGNFCGGDPNCGPFCDSFGDCFNYAKAGTACGASAGDAGAPFCNSYACKGGFSSVCVETTFNCGLTCASKVTCDETTKSCTAVEVQPGSCAIDGKCWADGDINPKDSCQWCNPPKSKTSWSQAASCVDSGVVDTGAEDTGSAAEDTGPVEDADAGAAPAPTEEDSGCGCELPGRPRATAPFLGLALALIALRRRLPKGAARASARFPNDLE